MVEPLRVSLVRHSVTDEGGAWRAQRDQLMRVHGDIAWVLAAERCLRCCILQKIAGHPVVSASGRQVLNGLAPISAMEFRAALARRTDQHYREPFIHRHGDQRSLAV